MTEATINIEKLKELISRCKNLLDDKGLSEDDTRAKLIDPLIKEVLGWNEDSLVRQPSVETKESIKRPDYWYPKVPKVIVEAKKLSVDLGLSNFDEQVLEYAYNRAVNIAILTNFKRFKAWYISNNGEISPFCNLDLLSDSLDDIETKLKWFQNESLLNNKIEAEVKKRGIQTGEIDISNELTVSINLVREKLNNYLKREYQTRYSDDDREELTQGIINRLIFIKKIEAEELEDKQLEPLIRRNSDNIYDKLKKIFEYYREEYDSDIFGKPNEKSEVEKIELGDNITKEILEAISHPLNKKLNYNFAAIDQDILGNMYENYLAYVQKRAKLIGGKTHKKEQGIYYTPKYIVDYILQNTLGERLKTAKLNEVKKLKILDPACGSGSFLIAAARILDEYYTKNYAGYNEFSPTEKLNTLKQNIYGVDLDEKAIKIAELNIYLTVLTLSKSKSLIKGELLPILRENLKIGNSLIEDVKIAGNKAFNWDNTFADIINNGKFDIIIGNPPYGAELTVLERKFLLKNYPATKNNTDTAIAFINKANYLLKKGGLLGFIVPKPLIYSQKWTAARDFIKNDLTRLVDVSKAFKDVLLEQVIIILKKNYNSKEYLIESLDASNKPIKINKKDIAIFGNLINNITEYELKIGLKLTKNKRYLSEVTNIERGVIIQKSLKKSGDIPIFRGKSIGRFETKNPTDFISNSDYNKLEKSILYLKKEKIIMQNIIAHVTKPKDHIILMANLDKEGVITLDNVGNIFINEGKKIDPLFVLALLNSKLISWYAYRFIYSKAIRTMRFDKYHLKKIPLCNYEITKEYKEVISLVMRMLSLKKELKSMAEKLTERAKVLKEEIERTDKEIDSTIYRIYELNEKEIETVENDYAFDM